MIATIVFVLIHSVWFSQGLHFISLDEARKGDVVYLTSDDSVLTIDASASNSRIVYFSKLRSYITYNFTYACRVNQQVRPIKGTTFCCRQHRDDPEQPCQSLSEKIPQGKFSCAGVEFSYVYDEFNGAAFTVKLSKNRMDYRLLSGVFSCSVTDANGITVVSPEVEVRDASYYFRRLPNTASDSVSVVDPIGKSDFPYAFKCAPDHIVNSWPEWMHTAGGGTGVYQWSYCEFSTPINVHTCNQLRKPFNEGSIVKYLNGTMYLLHPNFISKGNIAVLCRTEEHDDPVRTFAGGVQDAASNYMTSGLILDNSVPETIRLEPLVDQFQEYTFMTGSKLDGFSLKALYREPPSGSNFVWLKDGDELSHVGATKFSLQLSSRPQVEIEGKYELIVTSKADPHDKLTFTYIIHSTYPSKFVDPSCLSKLFYIMKGSNFKAMCKFYPKYFKNLYVGVNQFVGSTAEELRNRLARHASLNKMLSQLDINFEAHHAMPKFNEAIVDINSLQLGQDFELLLRLDGPFGGSHVHSSLKVIPTPILSAKPESSNCISDCDTKPYNVSCSIDRELISIWWTQYSITANVSWVIQNQWLSENLDSSGVGQYFTIPNADGSVLSVWPDGRPVEETDKLNHTQSVPKLRRFIAQNLGFSDPFFTSDLTLRCRIRLFVHNEDADFAVPPDSLLNRVARNIPAINSGLASEPRIIYDSSLDTDEAFAAQLTARRSFSVEHIGASMAWIAAVVIGILIVIIVLILSVWLYSRDRGETYKVYEKERAHGNDPLQEIKDTEVFKTYQRQEEQPIGSSHYSLNDESVHVASEDEGELSQYGADYDEHGSFIHGYSTDPALPRTQTAPKHEPIPAILPQTVSKFNANHAVA